MPFIRACLEEALRLYPPASTLSRLATKADMIAGTDVPKGSLIVISPYVVGRHRKLWENADLFRPERFLDGGRERLHRFQWLPFGAGPRVCIGQRFALLESVIVLAVLLARVRLDAPAGLRISPRQTVTLRPWPALPMLLSRRAG
jgi:cytochrome P450